VKKGGKKLQKPPKEAATVEVKDDNIIQE